MSQKAMGLPGFTWPDSTALSQQHSQVTAGGKASPSQPGLHLRLQRGTWDCVPLFGAVRDLVGIYAYDWTASSMEGGLCLPFSLIILAVLE